jgi:hypothetical protein
MLNEVPGFEIAQGYRGRPKGDIAVVAATTTAFSQLGAHIIIGLEGKGAWAVDRLLVTTAVRTGSGHA